MRAAIDIVLLVILAYSTWAGYKKGFINTVLAIVAICVSLLGGSLLSSAFSGEVIPAFEPFASGIIESKTDAAVAEIGYPGVSVEDIITKDANGRYEYANAVYQQVGIHPRRTDDMAKQAAALAVDEDISIMDATEQVLCRDMLYVAGTVLAAILILILITVIDNLFNLTFHIPNAPKLDIIGGTAAGFVRGFLICILLCWALSFLGMIIGRTVLQRSLLTRFFLMFEFVTGGIL